MYGSSESWPAGMRWQHEVLSRPLALPGQDLRHLEGRSDGGVAVKIIISYIDAEEQEAAGVLAALLRLLPGVRVRKNTAKAPHNHLYLTTRKSGKS